MVPHAIDRKHQITIITTYNVGFTTPILIYTVYRLVSKYANIDLILVMIL